MKEWFVKYWLEALFGLVVAGMGLLYRRLAKKISKREADQKALRAGTLALLRSEIIRNYDTYKSRGWIPIYAMENVLELYSAYHTLGGNGTMTKLADELKYLPSKDPEEESE